MKRIAFICNLYLGVLLLTLAVGLNACKKESVELKQLDANVDAQTIEHIIASGQKGIPFPAGSTMQRISENTYTLNLPAEYHYTLQNAQGEVTLSKTITVTCQCTTGNCSPVKFDNNYFCIQNEGCRVCTMTITNADGNKQSTNATNLLVRGLINKGVGITALSKDKVPQEAGKPLIKVSKMFSNIDATHGYAFPALFEIPEVKAYFEEMGKGLEQMNMKPNTYVYMNVYGNIVAVPFVKDWKVISDEKTYSAWENTEAVTCKCSSRTNSGTSCVKKSQYVPFIGTVYYCEAGSCTKCSLTDS